MTLELIMMMIMIMTPSHDSNRCTCMTPERFKKTTKRIEQDSNLISWGSKTDQAGKLTVQRDVKIPVPAAVIQSCLLRKCSDLVQTGTDDRLKIRGIIPEIYHYCNHCNHCKHCNPPLQRILPHSILGAFGRIRQHLWITCTYKNFCQKNSKTVRP